MAALVTADARAPGPAARSGLAVFSNGKKLADWAGQPTDHWDQEYFRREGEHLYVTARSNTILEFR